MQGWCASGAASPGGTPALCPAAELPSQGTGMPRSAGLGLLGSTEAHGLVLFLGFPLENSCTQFFLPLSNQTLCPSVA